ncbi:MAG: DMT family transporter [Anaerolineales bacterium]
MNRQSIPYILLQGLLFGTSVIASSFALGQFHPLTFLGLRLAMASLLFTAFYLWKGSGGRTIPKDRRLWFHASVIGILGTAFPMWAFISSLQYLSSGVTSALITIAPAFTLVLAHFLLPEEQMTRNKSLGVAFAFSGGLLIALRGESGLADGRQADSIGYILVFMAIIIGGCRTIYAQRFMRTLDTFDVASVRILTTTAVLLPISIWMVGIDLHTVDGWGYFALVYSTIAGTFLGIFGEFNLIKRFGATAAAMTAYVIPVVASLGGVLLLGEQITSWIAVGMAFILLGITLTTSR